jgi:hypothetical protein
MTSEQIQAIDDILAQFDFNKVHRVMEFLDWRWGHETSPPPLAELIRTARQCLEVACRTFNHIGQPPTGMKWATRGFMATVDVYPSGNTSLSLQFSVDDQEAPIR